MQSNREMGIRESPNKDFWYFCERENKGIMSDHKLGEGRKIVLSFPKCCEVK